jgi:PHP family Zn ribbon phosphoesterase
MCVVVIPGMEVETKEEIHLICLFRELKQLHSFDNIIYSALPYIKNNTQIYGQQLVMDENDSVTGIEEKLLASSVELSIEDIIEKVKMRNGIVIPAHIDRESFSIINTLGSIPEEFGIKTVEISKNTIRHDNNLYNTVFSSDAHRLGDILEKGFEINLENKTVKDILKKLG